MCNFQHRISCQRYHHRINEGFYIKLMPLGHFHDTRLLKRAIHEDHVNGFTRLLHLVLTLTFR